MRIIILCCTIFIISCNKEVATPKVPKPIVSFSIDSALTQSGSKLPTDINGFYHLKLNTFSNQTLSRITGRFNSNLHTESRIEWESSHYWILNAGDSVGKIVKTYFNQYTGQLTTSILPILVSRKDVIIPTINSVSQIGTNGEVNTMFAPVLPMKGDTITIIGKAIYTIEIPKDNLFSTTKTDSIKKSIRIICD